MDREREWRLLKKFVHKVVDNRAGGELSVDVKDDMAVLVLSSRDATTPLKTLGKEEWVAAKARGLVKGNRTTSTQAHIIEVWPVDLVAVVHWLGRMADLEER